MKNGFWPRYCTEDVNWLGYKKFDYIAYPMVCFCDIPLSRIDEHVKFYGAFGIGLTKEWAEANKITPILYVSTNSLIPQTFGDVADQANKLAKEEKVKAKQRVRYLLAHSKPTEGNMIIDGKVVSKEFYQESEWRYVPQNENISDYLNKKNYESKEKLEEHNVLSRDNCTITFTPKDVKYIFVKNDSDIPDMINFIQNEFDHFQGIESKVLLSRVTSLESIIRDL
jgi:hypothetical protein